MELTPPTPYRMSLTAAEVEELLLSVYTKIPRDIIRTSLVNPSDDTIPTTKAVASAIAVINADLDQLGGLSLLDELDLGSSAVVGTLPISKGGTGAMTVGQAQLNLGIVVESAIQDMIDSSIPAIQSVDLGSSRATGVLPLSKGGTGATGASQARTNLGVWSSVTSRSAAFESLRRTYAEAGLNLVVGSFEQGGTLNSISDVLLYEAEWKAYSWGGTFPKDVVGGTTPTPVGISTWTLASERSLRLDLVDPTGCGLIGFDTSLVYAPASVGFRLSNCIYITDAPYNARPNQTDISQAFLSAASTGRPIYFPEPKNPANYYKITGTVEVSEDLILHGPRSSKIVFDGVASGEHHIRATGKNIAVAGLTLESVSHGVLIRALPIDEDGIDSVNVFGTKFTGGFYSVRTGGTVTDPVQFPVKSITINDVVSTAPEGVNAGHFLSFGCERVRYLNTVVNGGRNTSALGAARCKDILIDGCTEKGVDQTVTGVEAAAQIEDSENCSGKIVNCTFEHDIWVSSSSGIKVRGNNCRELRVSTGSQYSTFDMKDIVFSENSAARINVQKYGSYANPQIASVDFIENTLDPASFTNLGSPYGSSYIIQGDVCSLIRLRGNKNISDAITNSMQITRASTLRLEVDDLSRFGSRPHLVSGSGGRILSDISLEDAVPSQGTTIISDILLGRSTDLTPTATGNFANIPFTTIAKNINSEYASESVLPIEDCVYHIGGHLTVESPLDGVRLGVRVYNETDNIILLALLETKLWAGLNTIPLLTTNIKLFSGKTYRIQYVTGDSTCVLKSGLSNTGVYLKGLI